MGVCVCVCVCVCVRARVCVCVYVCACVRSSEILMILSFLTILYIEFIIESPLSRLFCDFLVKIWKTTFYNAASFNYDKFIRLLVEEKLRQNQVES